MASVHSFDGVRSRLRAGHLKLWDDLLPVYLSKPDLFEFETVSGAGSRLICNKFDGSQVKEEIISILRTAAEKQDEEGVVFCSFPTDPVFFTEDLQPVVNEIIVRHGAEEWRLCCLTNEIHRHLGIYSIVGAKMGLRAREILGAGPDQVMVVSSAGSKPPLSCMNDGLQISTGATLGHGGIAISEDPVKRPEASFTVDGRTVILRLKQAYRSRIESDLQRGINERGALTPGYFDFVRKLAIKYWLEWSRKEIFEADGAEKSSSGIKSSP